MRTTEKQWLEQRARQWQKLTIHGLSNVKYWWPWRFINKPSSERNSDVDYHEAACFIFIRFNRLYHLFDDNVLHEEENCVSCRLWKFPLIFSKFSIFLNFKYLLKSKCGRGKNREQNEVIKVIDLSYKVKQSA